MVALCFGLLAGPLLAQDAVPIQATSAAAGPIAIVPIDSKNPDAAPTVTGALEVTRGRAIIAASGTVTSGTETTEVTLPRRGVLRVCAATTVKLASGSGAPEGVVPGLMMAMDHGAVEASFATGRDSDILLTPDFRILIGGPGAADVKVRLGANGDTCVDNAGMNAPYVLVTSVFDGGSYRVQPGQRVMFQHGNLHEVVDQEKEPCGCPPEPKGANEFPLAASEGLTATPAPVVSGPPTTTGTLAVNGADRAAVVADAGKTDAAPALTVPASAPVVTKPHKQHSAFVRFFRRLFGAED